MILSEAAINKRIKEYKKESKSKGYDTVLTEEEVANIDESINNIPNEYKRIFEMARDGNYSQFNSLPPYLKNYLGAKKMHEFKQKCGDNAPLNDQTKKFLEENAMDGAFRVAISTFKHVNENMNKYEVYMNEYLLVKTLTPANEEEKRNVINRIGDEKEAEVVINQNLGKQLIIAKTLFMAHLGKYDLKESSDSIIQYQGSIAETIVHGGRTNFVLPYGGDQKRMMQSYTGKNPKNNAGFDWRMAATHYTSERKVNDDGTLKKDAKEEKPVFYELHKILSKQYGMDIAAGGIGRIGPDKKAILSDGSAGHMYIRKETGDMKTCASLLVGFESAATGKVSFTGHKHTFLAKSSKQSAFMADKFGQGIKTDGRTVDLSGLDADTFTQVMEQFDKCYKEMQREGNEEKINKLNTLLSGKKSSIQELENILLEIGMDKSLIEKSVSRARSGLVGRNPVKEESIEIPSRKDLEKWANSFADELKKANINLSTGKGIDRIKFAQKQNGKIVLNDLFDSKKYTDISKCYQRLKSVLNSNFSVYVYGMGQTVPNQIKLNGLLTISEKNENSITIAAPKKPNFIKNILNKVTFGRAYKDEFSKYEFEKETYAYKCEERDVLNAYEKEREKVVKEELSEINRVSIDTSKIKFDVELHNKIKERQSQRVSDVSKNKSPIQNMRK